MFEQKTWDTTAVYYGAKILILMQFTTKNKITSLAS